MKKLLKLPKIPIACAFCTLLLVSCQKQEFESNRLKEGNNAVASRSECDVCDNLHDCCCWVELYNDSNNSASLHLCGTTDGAGACYGSQGNCNDEQNGGGQFISLNSGNTKQIFCMDLSSTVKITNVSSSDQAGIRCGCNTTSVDPIEFSLSPQDSVKVDANGSCELSGDCS